MEKYRVSQKRHPFKNITDLQSDDKIVKIMENIEFLYLSNLASFMGNPVYYERSIFKQVTPR